MKINRIINGVEIEIELTREEMIKVFDAIREMEYTDYIQSQIAELEEDDDRAIALERMSEDERKEVIGTMLFDFQELVDEQGYDWWDAWVEVSDEYLTE